MISQLALVLGWVYGALCTPMLIYSDNNVAHLYPDLALGAQISDADFIQQIIQPGCSDYKFKVFDVPDLSYEELTELARKANDAQVWPNLKKALYKAKFEKLLDFSGNGVKTTDCNVEYVDVPFNKESEQASVDVDNAISSTEGEAGEKVVFIIRSVPKIQRGSVNRGSDAKEIRVLKRRSANAVTTTATPPPERGNFFSTNCMLMNYGSIYFQPLGSAFKGNGKAFNLTGWNSDSLDCPLYQKEMNLTLVPSTYDNTLGISDIKLEMNVKTYLFTNNSANTIFFKYWYVDWMNLVYSIKSEVFSFPLTTGYIAAPQDKSYACQVPDIWPMNVPSGNYSYSATLAFHDIQFDVNFVFNNTNATDPNNASLPAVRNAFSQGVDCESKLGKGGILATLLFIVILLVGIYVVTIMSTAQNPVFGDKQIVVTQE